MKFQIVNESSIMLSISDEELDEGQHAATLAARPQRIAVLCVYLQSLCADDLLDCVAAFSSILLVFDTRRRAIKACLAMIDTDRIRVQTDAALASHSSHITEDAQPVCEIPVYYGPEVALDAALIAAYCGLDFAQCVQLHSQQLYQVCAIGFSLGFAYLGDLDAALAMPRMTTPRLRVPIGSVAIAERQTAVYPSATAGGWHIIGRTAQRLADPANGILPSLRVGDRVRFAAIERATYLASGGQLA